MNRDKKESILDRISIATPCTADWENMVGDERERFCHQCALNVYDISTMSKAEAEEFLTLRTQGRVCVQFYKRQDGTIITDNCPKGLRAIRNQGRKILKVANAFLALVISSAPFAFAQTKDSGESHRGRVRVLPQTENELQPQSQRKSQTQSQDKVPTKDEPRHLRGEIYVPPPKDAPACFAETEKTFKDKIGKLESLKSDKLEIARAHLDFASFYRSKNHFDSADAEYKIASELLAKIPKEKTLYKNALLNRAAVLKLSGKEKEAAQLERTAAGK